MSDPDDPGGAATSPRPSGGPATVGLADEQSVPVNGDVVLHAAGAALSALGMTGELSIALVDAATIADLKGRYYGEQAATDVLSFPMDGPQGPMIGDVVVCPQVAARQARGLGLTLDQEMRQLIVHGIVHLSGRDHLTPRDEIAMAAEERRIFAVAGA